MHIFTIPGLHALQAVLQVLQAALQAALHASLQAGQADVHVLAELLLSLMEYQHFHEFHWNSCQELVTSLVYSFGLVILLYTSFVANTWLFVICTPFWSPVLLFGHQFQIWSPIPDLVTILVTILVTKW